MFRTVIFSVICITAFALADVITVDDDAPADFADIQSAIDSAANGDVVIIQPGTYTGTGNYDIDFTGKAITVRSTDPNDPNVVESTVVDCNDPDPLRGFIFQSGEDQNSILSGLTIKNAFIGDANGAGILCINSSPLIENCFLTNNDAQKGGGIFLSNSSAIIKNCSIVMNGIYNNTAGNCMYGGGIYGEGFGYAQLINSEINSNFAAIEGSGIYGFVGEILNCDISDNGDTWYGSGLAYVSGLIKNCRINRNVAIQRGAGLYVCDADIINCDISHNGYVPWFHNAITGFAGGLYDCDGMIKDCTITYNQTYYAYGGMDRCDGLIENCLIANNQAEEGPGGGLANCHGTIQNCIIKSNESIDSGEGFGSGGGLANCDGTIINCEIVNNFCTNPYGGGGGGLIGCDGDIINCVISGNICGWGIDTSFCEGGGLSNCDANIVNCTIVGNVAEYSPLGNPPSRGGGLYECDGLIKNCIIVNNMAEAGSQLYDCNAVIKYNCIEDWLDGGTGNFNANPQFADFGYFDGDPTSDGYNAVWHNGDYHLRTNPNGRWSSEVMAWIYDNTEPLSPCIDAGDPNSDWSGEHWPHGKRINMGAYGGTVEASMSNTYTGLGEDVSGDSFVDLDDYQKYASSFNLKDYKIPCKRITVDGDLSEWDTGVQWIQLDKTYYLEPDDISEARFALSWDPNTDKVYAAVVIRDGDHVFSDVYDTWSASDRIEVYSQGSGDGGTSFWSSGDYDIAQHYAVGARLSDDGEWAALGTDENFSSAADLEYKVTVRNDIIAYEVGVGMFEFYGERTGEETVRSELVEGKIVRFDIVANTRYSSGFGVVSENLMLQKFQYADNFRIYQLVEDTDGPDLHEMRPDLNLDMNVNIFDLGLLTGSWLEGE